MAKETSIISEKMIDRFMEGIAKIVDKENEVEERKNQMKNEEFSEQKQAVKDLFDRIMAELNKLKPGTEEFNDVAESLYKIKSVMNFW